MFVPAFLLACLSSGFAPDDSAEKIVGVWRGAVVVGEATIRLRLEFQKDGKVKTLTETRATSISAEGTYKIDKGKLVLSTKSSEGKQETEVNTIKELTQERLILIDTRYLRQVTLTKE